MDLFIFSLNEILTSFRFIFVLALSIILFIYSVAFVFETYSAFLYGRFIKRKVGKIVFKDWFKFIRYCYKYTKSGVTTRWDDGSYWNNYNDWGCLNKKTGEWVTKKPKDKN